MVKSYTLQEVTLLVQNNTNLDRKIDKHSWLRGAVKSVSIRGLEDGLQKGFKMEIPRQKLYDGSMDEKLRWRR